MTKHHRNDLRQCFSPWAKMWVTQWLIHYCLPLNTWREHKDLRQCIPPSRQGLMYYSLYLDLWLEYADRLYDGWSRDSVRMLDCQIECFGLEDPVSQFEEITLGCLAKNGAWLCTFDVTMSSVNVRDFLHHNCSLVCNWNVFPTNLVSVNLDQYLQNLQHFKQTCKEPIKNYVYFSERQDSICNFEH